MLYEPTTLASVARLIGESLEGDYGIDPAPLFAELNIDTGKFLRPGARAPFTKMDELWRRAIAATSDPWFGFSVGERARPGDFFVLGHAWMASATLGGALGRLCRYSHVIITKSSDLVLEKHTRWLRPILKMLRYLRKPQKTQVLSRYLNFAIS
jgi:hypothetical protein